MSAVTRLLREARALGLLRPLAGDALALALAFVALAGLWIATPGSPGCCGSAHSRSVATEAGQQGGAR